MQLKRRRIVFMGMGGIFSLIPFGALLEDGANLVGVIYPGPSASGGRGPRWLPAFEAPPSDLLLAGRPRGPTLVSEAARNGIPILEVGTLTGEEALEALRQLQPELILVACFPRLLPPAWLETPALGCLNLHPSLLPAYRGPAPLFWQFQQGEAKTGVTLHFMDERADSGDIVSQAAVEFPQGVTGREADRMAAEAGGRLLLEALAGRKLPRRPQPAERASRYPYPGAEDRLLPVEWPVRRAFNFLRGADEWAPFEIQLEDGKRIGVTEALGYEAGAGLEAPFLESEGEVRVRFRDGVLRARPLGGV